MTERDRQNNIVRAIENDLHSMRLRENEISNKIRNKTHVERQIETMKEENNADSAKLKAWIFSVLN